MEEEWNEAEDVYRTTIVEVHLFTKLDLQRHIVQGKIISQVHIKVMYKRV